MLVCSTHPQTATDQSVPRILRSTRLTAGALVQGLLGLGIEEILNLEEEEDVSRAEGLPRPHSPF